MDLWSTLPRLSSAARRLVGFRHTLNRSRRPDYDPAVDDKTDIWPAGIVPTWGYQRGASEPFAAVAEALLAARFGWRLAVLRGEQAVGVLRSTGAFDLVGAKAFLDRPDAALNFLAVSNWMRFGNAVRQVTNAFYVADRYGARHIEFPSSHAILRGDGVNGVDLTWQPSSGVGGRKGLRGTFYYLQGLNLSPAPEDVARIVRSCVRPLVSPAVAEPRGEVRPDDLVLHFRAGDVFGTNPRAFIHFTVNRRWPTTSAQWSERNRRACGLSTKIAATRASPPWRRY